MTALSEPLTAAQLRILGVLIEKQLATPQAYPLTENALLTGCNQSTNRDPVVAYDSAVVRPAMIQLRALNLARRVKRVGERVEKHAHRVDEQLGLSSSVPLAILGMLMLRGAQTPGELRTRTQRLTPDADSDSFEAALTELRDRGLAQPLPRGPGEKQPRWQQLLGDAAATDGTQAVRPTDPARTGDPGPGGPGTGTPGPGTPGPGTPGGGEHPDHRSGSGGDVTPVPTNRELAAAVERLRERVAHLERELGLDDGPPDEN
jgi:uncharacterized protein